MSYRKHKRLQELQWVERVSTLLDSKFQIGGFRFGLDPLLNFVPLLGQSITFGVSVLLVIVMYRNGVSANAATKMLLNTIWDAVIGSIPVFGNVFDFFFKANRRNIHLLKEHYLEDKHQGSAKGLLTALFLGLLALCALFFYLLNIFGAWLIRVFVY